MEQLELPQPPDPDKIEATVSALTATQPVGDLYLAVFPSELLCKISYFDVRRMVKANRDVEEYLGIQRPLNGKRVQELESYVNFHDASFPTAIIIAIDDQHCEYDEETKVLKLRNYVEGAATPDTNFRNLARVIDGQHRIAGLQNFSGENGSVFQVPVVVFIGADISDQAYIFATVNLKQTKVNKSLAYDLYDLESTNSPEKVAHDIAVAFDRDTVSPFYGRIKRLGVATPGRTGETITQATFVEALVKLISDQPKDDRDRLLKSKNLVLYNEEKLVLRRLFLDGQFMRIAENLDNFFQAISGKWPNSWRLVEQRNIFNKTNGFKAQMRLFKDAYASLPKRSGVVAVGDFRELLNKSRLPDGSFVSPDYEPGSSGEGKLYRELKASVGLE
jgi:DGQHR domain-containing protein